jgi:hypothetical protein
VSPAPLPVRTRRLLTGGLAVAGLFVLLARAQPDVPLAVSFSVAAKFWRASYQSRLLNAAFFRGDTEFAAAVVTADARWPLAVDVVLTLPPAVPADEAEKQRRAAGLVLAPRRVVLERAEIPDARFELRMRPSESR